MFFCRNASRNFARVWNMSSLRLSNINRTSIIAGKEPLGIQHCNVAWSRLVHISITPAQIWLMPSRMFLTNTLFSMPMAKSATNYHVDNRSTGSLLKVVQARKLNCKWPKTEVKVENYLNRHQTTEKYAYFFLGKNEDMNKPVVYLLCFSTKELSRLEEQCFNI